MRGERSALDGLGALGSLQRASLTACDAMPRMVTTYCADPAHAPPACTAALACLLSTIVAWTTLTAGESLLRLPAAMGCAARGCTGSAAFDADAAPPSSSSSSEWPRSPSCSG